uniref:POU domain protein n=1 Tax=Strigamia maritima TaxID=126957 RepID=T1JKC0_STRMM
MLLGIFGVDAVGIFYRRGSELRDLFHIRYCLSENHSGMDSDGTNEAAAVLTYSLSSDEDRTQLTITPVGKSEDSLISSQLPVMSVAPGTLTNHTMPLGSIVSMAAPTQLTGNLQDQLLVAVQSMANGTMDGNDELKLDSTTTDSSQLSAVGGTKLNGTTQITAGGLATMMNIQGLSGIPQMATIGLHGLNLGHNLGQISQSANVNVTLATPNHTNVGTSSIATNGTGPSVVASHTTALSHQTHPALTQVAMPQFILAGGQLLQGVQGAQLLIPTSSGVATQQILTIPINQVTGGQMVQLVASNGQVYAATMNNLQGIAAPQPISVGGVSSTSAGAGTITQQLLPGNLQGLTNQMTTIPQFVTNASGQMMAIGSQLITQPVMAAANQPTSVVHIQGQTSHMTTENKTTSISQVVSSAAKTQIQQTAPQAIAPTLVQQAHTAQIQIATVGASNQLGVQTLQRAPTTTGTQQVLQVTQNQVTSAQQAVTTSTPNPEITNTISQSDANTVDGINLEEIKEFAKAFKIRRLSLGLTQTQVGQALSITEGPAYSQSAICRFEKLDITPKSAQKIKPVLERWMKEAEERYKNGAQNLTEFIGTEPSKKRKRRTSFTPQALDILNQHFERNTHPSGAEMTELAEKLNYDREVVRVWFCNKRQALKNTIKKLKPSPEHIYNNCFLKL